MEQRFVEDKFPGDCIEWAYAEIKRISPWVEEKGDGNDVGRLEKQRAALDERIARLKAADPKGAPPPSTTSSIARGG